MQREKGYDARLSISRFFFFSKSLGYVSYRVFKFDMCNARTVAHIAGGKAAQ